MMPQSGQQPQKKQRAPPLWGRESPRKWRSSHRPVGLSPLSEWVSSFTISLYRPTVHSPHSQATTLSLPSSPFPYFHLPPPTTENTHFIFRPNSTTTKSFPSLHSPSSPPMAMAVGFIVNRQISPRPPLLFFTAFLLATFKNPWRRKKAINHKNREHKKYFCCKDTFKFFLKIKNF